MKQVLTQFALLLTTFLVATGALAQNEEEAIKKAIRNETDAYFRRDYNAWKATWAHDSKVSRTVVAQNFLIDVTGWEKADPDAQKDFTSNPTPMKVDLDNDNFLFRTSGNMAWVEYDQTLTMSGESKPQHSREYRLMVKENGQWKLASQVTVVPESFGSEPKAIENDLNTTGYKLLNAKRVNDAIEVFKLNVKLHPDAWNPYDSLGEAYAVAGNKDEAIKNYQKSIELNPQNDNGKKALEKLKQK